MSPSPCCPTRMATSVGSTGFTMRSLERETRGRFLIDPDGIVQAFEVMTPPVGRNVAETLRQIKAFQLVRESKGTAVTPAGWKPGKTTLKPGPELVGNVWKEWNPAKDLDD